MTTVLLVGAGAVGGRAARQLVETEGIDRLLVADARPERAADVAKAMGDSATVVGWQAGTPLPDGVDVVACAVPAGDDVTVVRDALQAGVPCVSAADDTGTIQVLLELAPEAADLGVPVVVGAGLAPGLSDVLLRHAADAFDVVDDVNVARWGAAGEASASTVRVALADKGAELRGGEVHELRKRGGEELVWFPNPVNARACEPVANGLELLRDAVPELDRATVRFARRSGHRGAGRGGRTRSTNGAHSTSRSGAHAVPLGKQSSTARSNGPRPRPAPCSRWRWAG